MGSERENGTDSVTTNGTSTIPEWLNKDYFKDILDQDFEKYQIRNFTVANATAKGENYASLMLRVTVDLTLEDGTQKTRKYIVKTVLLSELSKDMMGALAVFPKEIEVYEKIIPKINQMYQEAGLDFEVGAKCYKTQTNPPVIVLEDLSVDSYENINRLEGMDVEHARATLAKLAKFHAASVRMYEMYGPFSENFNHGLLKPELVPMIQDLMNKMWPILEDCIHKWGDCERFTEQLKSAIHHYCELLLTAQACDPDEFNVLNHGDMWCNNIMFRHSKDGSIDDLKFVDLQLCNWGSPVLDLQYFLMSSCSYDSRITKYDYFVRYYHEHLVENLKLLQYQGKLPKLVDLQIQMLKRGFFSINVCLGTMAIVLLDPNDKADLDVFFTETDAATEFKKQMYLSPRYVRAIKPVLEFLDNRGILDM